MFITILGAGAVGAASRYGSDQMMRIRLRNTGRCRSLVVNAECGFKSRNRPVRK
jgi:hypothetical protein